MKKKAKRTACIKLDSIQFYKRDGWSKQDVEGLLISGNVGTYAPGDEVYETYYFEKPARIDTAKLGALVALFCHDYIYDSSFDISDDV